jgi:hypothetical protein
LKSAQANERFPGEESSIVMKWYLVGGMVALAGAALVANAVPGTAVGETEQTVWWADYPEARAAARKSGKPLLVVFR